MATYTVSSDAGTTARVITASSKTFVVDGALRGPAGAGVPTGGTTGQVLIKDSGTSFDTAWTDQDRPYVTVGRAGSGAQYICDGVADDVQIQAAIDAVKANTSGGVVWLKKGTSAYSLADSLVITGSNVTLTGDPNTRIALANTVNKAMIKVGDGSTTTNNITIRDLLLDGNKSNQTPTSGNTGSCIYVNTATDVLIENVDTLNARTFGVLLSVVSRFAIRNCTMTTPGGSYSVLAAGDGVLVAGDCHYGLIENITIDTPYRIGVTLDAGGGTASDNIKVVNCQSIAGDRGYHAENFNHCSFINCTVVNTTGAVFGSSATTNETASPAILLGNNTSHILVDSCTIKNCQEGIQSYIAYRNVIANNTVDTVTWAGIMVRGGNDTNTVISGNTVKAPTTDGVYVTGGSNNIVVGNTVEGAGSRGIYLLSTTKLNLVEGNIVDDSVFAGIQLDNASNNTVLGNTVNGSGTQGVNLLRSSYNNIVANQVNNSSQTTNNTSPAIHLQTSSATGSTFNNVSSNTVTDTASNKASYGVRESASTDDNNRVRNNTFSGQVTAAISLQGTSSTSVAAIAEGGTGSATKNFVDLTNAQSVAGVKTWSNQAIFGSTLNSSTVSGHSLGRSAALSDMTLHVARTTGEGDPTPSAGTIAMFQSNSGAGFSGEVSIVVGTTGSAKLGFGDKDAPAAGALTWNNNGDTFQFGGGNVGISKTPTVPLDVNGSTKVGSGTGGTATDGLAVVHSANSGNVNLKVQSNYTTGSGGSHLSVVNASATLLTFDSSGRLGIGVAPTSMFQVAGPIATAYSAKTSNYTVLATDSKLSGDCTSGNLTFTLPAAASISGREYHFKRIDASGNSVIVDGNASETIDGATTKTLGTQWASLSIYSNGTNWLIKDQAGTIT